MRLLLQHFCVAVLMGVSAFGQSFEAASVKPSAGNGRSSMKGGPDTGDPSQITYTNVSLMSVLLKTYDLKSYQATGPEWLSSQRYDITARIPARATKEQFGAMLRNLLTDRFHMAVHHETRQLDGFELVVGRNGVKMTEAASTDTPAADLSAPPKKDANGFPQFNGPGLAMMEGVRGRAVVTYLRAQAQPVSALADLLIREFRQPVLDKTALTARFDFTLEFAPQAPGAVESAPPDPDGAPNLIGALQQQLGLRLNRAKIPTEVTVVDRADRIPTEN